MFNHVAHQCSQWKQFLVFISQKLSEFYSMEKPLPDIKYSIWDSKQLWTLDNDCNDMCTWWYTKTLKKKTFRFRSLKRDWSLLNHGVWIIDSKFLHSLVFWFLKKVTFFKYTYTPQVIGELIFILQFYLKITNLHHTAGCEKIRPGSYIIKSTPEVPYLFYNINQWIEVKPPIIFKEAFKSIFTLHSKQKIQGLWLQLTFLYWSCMSQPC